MNIGRWRSQAADEEGVMMKPFESDVAATPSSIAVDGQLALTDRLFAALDATLPAPRSVENLRMACTTP
jgi:hypothetical protein